MWIYRRFMDVFYLNVRQGAATSIFGALGKEIFLGNSNENDNGNGNVEEYDKGGRWCEHPMIPYFIPYRMPIRALGFEMLNFFAGPRKGLVSLTNPSPGEKARELWEFSDKLTETVTGEKI